MGNAGLEPRIVIKTAAVQNLFAPFCRVLGRDILRRISFAWRSLQAVLNFSRIFLKN